MLPSRGDQLQSASAFARCLEPCDPAASGNWLITASDVRPLTGGEGAHTIIAATPALLRYYRANAAGLKSQRFDLVPLIQERDELRYAQESSWREDNRRVSNGDQVNRVAAPAMRRQVDGLYRVLAAARRTVSAGQMKRPPTLVGGQPGKNGCEIKPLPPVDSANSKSVSLWSRNLVPVNGTKLTLLPSNILGRSVANQRALRNLISADWLPAHYRTFSDDPHKVVRPTHKP